MQSTATEEARISSQPVKEAEAFYQFIEGHRFAVYFEEREDNNSDNTYEVFTYSSVTADLLERGLT